MSSWTERPLAELPVLAGDSDLPVRAWCELRPGASSWVCVLLDTRTGERVEFCAVDAETLGGVRGYVPWDRLGREFYERDGAS